MIDSYATRLSSRLHWKYVLRPITTRMDKQRLLLPIPQYDHWGLPPDLNREWAIMDTFDMLSPVHDHPRSVKTVTRWFEKPVWSISPLNTA